MHRVIWRLAIASTTDDGSKIGIPTKNVEFLPAAHTSLLCYFQNPPALMCKNTDLILMMAHIHRQIRMYLFRRYLVFLTNLTSHYCRTIKQLCWATTITTYLVVAASQRHLKLFWGICRPTKRRRLK